MKSNYENVLEFHETFGVATPDKPLNKICDTDKKLLEFRISLIEEELNELKDAIKNKDFVEIVDALGDISYVVNGFGAVLGVDMDKAFNLIHSSNMTKACETEQEAIDTCISISQRPDKLYTPSYRKSNGKFVVFDTNTGKILKSKYYTPVDLKCFDNSV